MKTKSIRQTATFNAKGADLYNLIMDEKKHAVFTGAKVAMSPKVNGEFTVFDGYCRGHNIELTRGKKIVQAWHFSEDGWPKDHFSICTFAFETTGEKTKLTFLQTGVPEHKVESLKKGWKDYYWTPMKAYLKNNER